MIRFLRKWLVPILAVLMLAGLALTYVPLTRQAQARAQGDLTLVMDRAFEHIGAGARLAGPVIQAEEDNLLSKAKAVARFLAHDDALLATDALTALCEQLSVDRIDVSDVEGTLIASSDAARISLPLGAQNAFAFAMATVSDPNATYVGADETEKSTLYACVGRSDIEGFVLLTRDDPYASAILTDNSAEAAIASLTYGKDVVFEAASGGEDGFFTETGNLCLRRTEDGVTLIAARPTSEVFAVRNAAFMAFGAALTCVIICGIAAYLLNLEPVAMLDEGDPALEDGEEMPLLPDETDHAEQETSKLRARRKNRKSRAAEEADEETGEEAEESAPDEAEFSDVGKQPADAEYDFTQPRPERVGRKKTRRSSLEEPQENSENGFEKIVD